MQVSIPELWGDVSDEKEAAEIGGYVARVTDMLYEKVKPRWSELQREKMMRASEPSDDVTLRRLLSGFPGDWAGAFMRHNKLVGTERNIAEFAPRLPVPEHASGNWREAELDAYDTARDYYPDPSHTRAKQEAAKSVPKYFLHQIFSDTSVAEKLLLDAGMMIVVSRTAVGNPKAACDLVVKHAAAHGMKIVVRVGDYSTGRKASRMRLLNAAAGLTVQPYTPEVVGGRVLVRGVSGKGLIADWTISGDLWQMVEIDAVYRLATDKGATIVNTLFTMDMLKLGIELEADGEDYGFDVQLHVGEYDESVSGNRVEVFGSAAVGAARGVFPVMCDGKVMASAVYAGGSQVYVNWHVVSDLSSKVTEESPLITIRIGTGDTEYSISLVNEVAADVWLADVDSSADFVLSGYSPPVCRTAVKGERVVAVYAVPTGVECTDAGFVDSVDMGAVCMLRFPQARSGMSGAAIVAINDGALLASYTGSNRTYSLGSSLKYTGDDDWMSRTVAPVIAPQAFSSGKGAGALYHDMKARGLGPRLTRVSEALSPLFSEGKLVGNEFFHASGSATVLDPSVWDVVDPAGLVAEFTDCRNGGVRELPGDVTVGGEARAPVLGEVVFSVHRDDKGVIFSDLFKVIWISPDGSRCRLDGVPQFESKNLKGSVLVALSDCATLGLVSKFDEAVWGPYSECSLWSDYFQGVSGFGQIDMRSQGVFRGLANRFDRLKTSTWLDEDVEALVVGDLPLTGTYSRVGSTAVMATILGHFSRLEVQGVERMVTSKFLDDDWMRLLCDRVLPVTGGTQNLSLAHRLTMLRTFWGLVYLREGNSGLHYVLDEIGLFDTSTYDSTGLLLESKFNRPRSI